MGLAGKLNSGRRNTVPDEIDTKNIRYISAADYAKDVSEYPLALAGFFIKDGDYGKQVTVIVRTVNGTNFLGLNIPKRYVEMFESFTEDEVEDIKAGKLGISMIEPDVKTPKGKTTAITFIDM